MALTSYQALRLHHTKLACTMDNKPNTIPSPAQHANKHTAANNAPPHHMSSTDNTLEQEECSARHIRPLPKPSHRTTLPHNILFKQQQTPPNDLQQSPPRRCKHDAQMDHYSKRSKASQYHLCRLLPCQSSRCCGRTT